MAKTRNITNDEWNAHKKSITALYKAYPLAEVRRIMKEDHNFSASKSQYIGKFNQWGLKKNSTSEKWRFIAQEVRKRKLEGKESEIYIHGKLIPNKTVKKETSRYDFPTFIKPQLSSPSLDTLEGILVCTPKSNGPASPLRLDITTNVMNYGSICQNKRVITETVPDEDLNPCKKQKVELAATRQSTIQYNLSQKEDFVKERPKNDSNWSIQQGKESAFTTLRKRATVDCAKLSPIATHTGRQEELPQTSSDPPCYQIATPLPIAKSVKRPLSTTHLSEADVFGCNVIEEVPVDPAEMAIANRRKFLEKLSADDISRPPRTCL